MIAFRPSRTSNFVLLLNVHSTLCTPETHLSCSLVLWGLCGLAWHYLKMDGQHSTLDLFALVTRTPSTCLSNVGPLTRKNVYLSPLLLLVRHFTTTQIMPAYGTLLYF